MSETSEIWPFFRDFTLLLLGILASTRCFAKAISGFFIKIQNILTYTIMTEYHIRVFAKIKHLIIHINTDWPLVKDTIRRISHSEAVLNLQPTPSPISIDIPRPFPCAFKPFLYLFFFCFLFYCFVFIVHLT